MQGRDLAALWPFFNTYSAPAHGRGRVGAQSAPIPFPAIPDKSAPLDVPADGNAEQPASDSAGDPGYSVPMGESGLSDLTHVNETNSFLRLYAIERQHAAIQAREARADGAESPNTFIDFKTAVLEGGAVQAVAAETSTTGDVDGDGDAEMLDSELAYVDRIGTLPLSGKAAFGLNGRVMPLIVTSGSVGATRRMMDNRNAILSVTRQQDPATIIRNLSNRETARLQEAYAPIEQSVRSLQEALVAMEYSPALGGATVTSSSSAITADFIAGERAEVGSHTVTVEELAQAHAVESNRTWTGDGTMAALGFTGRFAVNGASVAVKSSDSLYAITTGINAAATGDNSVNATIEGGRMRLTRKATGPDAMTVQDPNQILENLGILTRDAKDIVTFAREVQAPRAARYIFDDRTTLAHGNTVSEAGLSLTFKATTPAPATISVEPDPERLADSLQGFVDRFNDAMRALNAAVAPQGGTLNNEEAANRARLRLRNASTDPVAGGTTLSTAAQAGIIPNQGRQSAFRSLQLQATAYDMKSRMVRTADDLTPLQRASGIPTVTNSLDHFGILEADNDTLQLDRSRLQTAMHTDFGGVRSLFSGSDGYLSRMRTTADALLRDGSGLLDIGRARLSAYSGVLAPDLASESATSSALRREVTMLQGLLVAQTA